MSCSQDVREPRFLTTATLTRLAHGFFPHSHLVCVLNKTISYSFLLDTYFVHTLSFHTLTLSVFFFIPSVAYRFLNAPSVYKRVCENDMSDNETTTYRFYQSHIIVTRARPYSGLMYVLKVAAFEQPFVSGIR